jgi:hypothetical protein
MSEDLIRRSDAIKAIEELPNAYNGWSDAYDKAYIIGTLEEVPSADRPQEWIPCSERLPSNFSEDETVLATTDVDGDGVIPMFAFDVKSFYLKGYVSAWMPLPKPWKGADDENN